MEVTDSKIRMTLEELDNELDSGSDLAMEIVSLVMSSSRPWSVAAAERGEGSMIPVYSPEEEASLSGITKSLASKGS